MRTDHVMVLDVSFRGRLRVCHRVVKYISLLTSASQITVSDINILDQVYDGNGFQHEKKNYDSW